MRKGYSIIIPHFSRTDDISLLVRGLKSIPQRDDIQIIVVDNSIVEVSFDVLKDYKNVVVYHCDNKRKAGGARNVGIENATGEWILFLDSDDFFTEEAFRIFDDYYYSDNDIVYFAMTSCFSDDTSRPANREIMCNEMIARCVDEGDDYGLRILLPTPCAKMVRTSFIKDNNILFDEVPARNDVMFCLKVGLNAKKIAADKRAVYCATVTEGSITKVKNWENVKSRFDVNIRKNKMLKENGYKRIESVLPLVMQSIKLGFGHFCNLFFRALFTGNLFVGIGRWLRRLIKTA